MHRIDKDQHANHATIVLRDQELDPNEPTTFNLIENIAESYFKRSSRQYSKFATGENDPVFKTLLDTFLDDDDNFVQFSRSSTELLKEKMCDKPASTGGYVVVADFELENRFVMVILMNKKGSVTVDDNNLDVGAVRTLDIDQFAMAGLINLSVYLHPEDDRRYMSFMRGERDVSDYFTRFIGSAQEGLESATVTTGRLVDTIQSYMHNNEYEQERMDNISSAVLQYGESQKRERQPISLSAVANLVNHENPDEFFQFAQNNEISAYIESIDMRSLKRLQDFQYRGRGYTIKFKKNLIADEMVTLHGHQLTITVDDQFIQTWIAEGMGEVNE